jgi:hypothetical protein
LTNEHNDAYWPSPSGSAVTRSNPIEVDADAATVSVAAAVAATPAADTPFVAAAVGV